MSRPWSSCKPACPHQHTSTPRHKHLHTYTYAHVYEHRHTGTHSHWAAGDTGNRLRYQNISRTPSANHQPFPRARIYFSKGVTFRTGRVLPKQQMPLSLAETYPQSLQIYFVGNYKGKVKIMA